MGEGFEGEGVLELESCGRFEQAKLQRRHLSGRDSSSWRQSNGWYQGFGDGGLEVRVTPEEPLVYMAPIDVWNHFIK